MRTIKGDRGGQDLVGAAAMRAPTGTFGAGSVGSLPKVITIALCQDQLMKTDGQNANWLADIYDLPEIRALGPMIKQIRVHFVAEAATTNFSAKVTTAWSVLGKTWSAAVDLLAEQTGTITGVISSAYTTDSAFGLLMRYAIETKNSSGTAIESARVTVVLEIELKS